MIEIFWLIAFCLQRLSWLEAEVPGDTLPTSLALNHKAAPGADMKSKVQRRYDSNNVM